MNKTTEALKLAEEALDTFIFNEGVLSAIDFDKSKKSLASIREALAEPVEQEPVAWMQIGIGANKGTTMFVTRLPNWHMEDEWQFEPLYTSPLQPVKQEPVGVVESSEDWGVAGVLIAGLPIGTKLYAEPVQPVKQDPKVEHEQYFSDGTCSMKQFSNGVTEWYGSEGNVILSKGSVTLRADSSEPVDTKAIQFASANARAEALEEAAKVCESKELRGIIANMCAAAIRGLK